MIAKIVAMSAQPTAMVLVVIEVMSLMAVRLECIAELHLRLEALVAAGAIDQGMVLPVVVVVIHVVLGGGVGARRAVRGRSVVVRLKEVPCGGEG